MLNVISRPLAVGLAAVSLALGTANAQNTIYYASTDGTIRAIDINTQAEIKVIPANAFAGGIVGGAREFAFDPGTRLIWYSATDNTIRSLNADTLAAGPMIPSAQIQGAGIGSARHLYIDSRGGRLLTPTTNNTVQMFRLSDQQTVGVIPSNAFGGMIVGAFIHLAPDPRTNSVWFAHTTGFLFEIDLTTLAQTGRSISAAKLIGGNSGAFRHMFVDVTRDLLFYTVTDGSMTTLNMTTQDPGGITINSFAGANPGAARTVSSDTAGRVAYVTSIGAGCSGSLGVPVLDAAPGSSPVVGSAFSLQLDNVPTGLAHILFVGAVPLPAPYTFPQTNCMIHINPLFGWPAGAIPLPTSRRYDMTLPADPMWIGVPFFCQGVVGDPGANVWNLTVSNAVAVVVGQY